MLIKPVVALISNPVGVELKTPVEVGFMMAAFKFAVPRQCIPPV